MKYLRLFALAVLVFQPGPSRAALPDGFEESFTVARSEWYRGEPVALTYRVCNATDTSLKPCQLRCNPRVTIHRDDDTPIASTRPGGCGAACRNKVWEPGECSESRYHWPQTEGELHSGLDAGEQVPPGLYYARFGGESDPLVTGPFELLAATMPVPAAGWSALAALGLALLVPGCRRLRRE